MTPLLEQFLAETRDVLEGIGKELMRLESRPGDPELMTSLFRMVHTLKGNSGLFDLPELTRVLHAGEDLMDGVRHGRVAFSQGLADHLLDAMDFVGMLCDEIEAAGEVVATGSVHAAASARLASDMRSLIPAAARAEPEGAPGAARELAASLAPAAAAVVRGLPEAIVARARAQAAAGQPVHWIGYHPAQDCFFQGTDPFFQAQKTPGLLWGSVVARGPWPPLVGLDAYRCELDFHVVAVGARAAFDEHFRYVPEQVHVVDLSAELRARPLGEGTLGPDLAAALASLVAVQREIWTLPIETHWHLGRMAAAAAAMAGGLRASGELGAVGDLEAATASALVTGTAAPLLAWLDGRGPALGSPAGRSPAGLPLAAETAPEAPAAAPAGGEPKYGRRSDDALPGARSLKVDQVKIDRLMNLIGEMVVSKNALPYLAARAEAVFGVRELSREIQAQYATINRIAQEMQDAIMQVRMMPVSFVFQRFPRLVRDTSRKLGKDVELVLEGEDTEADKNIIESLGDPLVHIVRNSLDHGFEAPEVRRAAGKPATGKLTIRASQEADRVVIEVSDDGRGIDPAVIKLKAYEKGLIDEAALERIGDQEAIELVFAPGFSTSEAVSELSGRGVGMDVVRTAVERVNGTVTLDSAPGKGTRIRLSLPLSMAVTNVMIIEADRQKFGLPMDCVVETVRVARSAVRTIKDSLAVVLRGRLVPLKSIHALLGLDAAPKANRQEELAVLVVRVGNHSVGLLVDDFRETAEIILKPMTGVLAGLATYAGSALMGDGSVLMVLNAKEMV
jgi:two-component system chemotaxis sensor kinase CheA